MSTILFILACTVNFWLDTNETKLLDTQQVAVGDDAIQPADPDSVCYAFMGWDGNFQNVQQDLNIHAIFTEKKYILSIDSEPEMLNGTIVAAPPYAFDETNQITDIPCGTTVSVSAVPENGYILSKWYQNGVELNTTALTIDILLDESTVLEGNIAIRAVFEEDAQTDIHGSQATGRSADRVQKMLRDGQILIIRNGKTYNAPGAEVR